MGMTRNEETLLLKAVRELLAVVEGSPGPFVISNLKRELDKAIRQREDKS